MGTLCFPFTCNIKPNLLPNNLFTFTKHLSHCLIQMVRAEPNEEEEIAMLGEVYKNSLVKALQNDKLCILGLYLHMIGTIKTKSTVMSALTVILCHLIS